MHQFVSLHMEVPTEFLSVVFEKNVPSLNVANKLQSNVNHILHFTNADGADSLEQAWSTSGPRATCGPRSTLMWPVTNNIIILDSYFYVEIMLKSRKLFIKITLK